MSNVPNRFFSVTRWRLNLSSGEKRAGWADDVGKPLASTFFSVYVPSSVFMRYMAPEHSLEGHRDTGGKGEWWA